MKLHSIATEAKNCRKAFKGFEHRGFTLHCHHEILGEPLTEPAKNRIAYILSNKSEHEQALRLRLFRPITEKQLKSCKGYAEFNKARTDWHKASDEWNKANAEPSEESAEYNEAYAEYSKACADWHKACADWHKADAEFSKDVHDKFCVKGCPWNGKTIFP